MLATLLTIAIVVQDPVSLRAAPQEGATRQATLWQGEWLEVRGERQGYLQVYDHRRERPGYVREHQVRVYRLEEQSVPQLRAVLEFLKDTPGSEALGIGYAAALLRAAPAHEVGPELFDALGTLAERLARRASVRKSTDETLAAHLEVAGMYGVKLASLEQEGRTRICYDGEAFRRVLALGGSPQARLRAALALTRPECVDPELGPVQRQAIDVWRGEVLEQVDTAQLPAWMANRLHVRRAEVLAALAYHRARRGEVEASAQASERAVESLARVLKSELAEEDRAAYAVAAVRVGASRWASERVPEKVGAGPVLELSQGGLGETCLRLGEGESPLAERCTYGVVWPGSIRRTSDGSAVTVAVQMLEGWTELWVFHQEGAEWRLDTLTPAATGPGLGYVELAGFSPDGSRLLVAREAQVEGKVKTSFQVLKRETLTPLASAERPQDSGTFQRWSSAEWRARTVSMR
ncbi:hypothetical protein [Stigmatella aurantiaca]|uniref:Conserved uncharacterized protein n=1 Tax=Stigmatella aurantiaca (strain DW4/3-1) TaxID=378806 RepID=Q090V6_STIAD|nr:hypothetical protein [Stigmatella aurantiaca]ADO75690.1 conserved uncharacterized protein [Stigmatella aurantiaca DW4/3-1]EAU66250.1 hypothetical protein STIAU_3825 [Stigmatella aurantiaca DW4/3-1]